MITYLDDKIYNYCALAVSILANVSVDKALIRMELTNPNVATDDHLLDVEGAIRMREDGLSFREIGEIYGVSPDVIWKRIKQWKGESL
jgi:hypothetical protein